MTIAKNMSELQWCACPTQKKKIEPEYTRMFQKPESSRDATNDANTNPFSPIWSKHSTLSYNLYVRRYYAFKTSNHPSF